MRQVKHLTQTGLHSVDVISYNCYRILRLGGLALILILNLLGLLLGSARILSAHIFGLHVTQHPLERLVHSNEHLLIQRWHTSHLVTVLSCLLADRGENVVQLLNLRFFVFNEADCFPAFTLDLLEGLRGVANLGE